MLFLFFTSCGLVLNMVSYFYEREADEEFEYECSNSALDKEGLQILFRFMGMLANLTAIIIGIQMIF